MARLNKYYAHVTNVIRISYDTVNTHSSGHPFKTRPVMTVFDFSDRRPIYQSTSGRWSEMPIFDDRYLIK